MIFLWEPLEAQPHDPDFKALLRIAVVYDIPVVNILATADFMLNTKFMNDPYSRQIVLYLCIYLTDSYTVSLKCSLHALVKHIREHKHERNQHKCGNRKS